MTDPPRILTRRQFLRSLASVAAGAVVLPEVARVFLPGPTGVIVPGVAKYNGLVTPLEMKRIMLPILNSMFEAEYRKYPGQWVEVYGA